MSNPEKTSSSADKKEEDEEESRTNTATTTTTTTTTVVTTPPSTRRRRTVQFRPASGESKKSKSSAVKGAGSSSSSSTKTGKEKRKSGELDAPKGEPRCPLCGSRFGSWKGYFGHLRVHKRSWTGAFPPPIFGPPDKKIIDEEFQDYMASELSRIGHETLTKMRHEASSTGASDIGARNVGIDLNVAPDDDHRTAEFDLNLPPRSNIDSDDDDTKKDDDI